MGKKKKSLYISFGMSANNGDLEKRLGRRNWQNGEKNLERRNDEAGKLKRTSEQRKERSGGHSSGQRERWVGVLSPEVSVLRKPSCPDAVSFRGTWLTSSLRLCKVFCCSLLRACFWRRWAALKGMHGAVSAGPQLPQALAPWFLAQDTKAPRYLLVPLPGMFPARETPG